MNSTLKSIIDELSKLSNKHRFERLAFDMNIDGQVVGSFTALDDENYPIHINDYKFDALSIFFMCKSISIFSKVVVFNCVYPAKNYVNDIMFAEDAYDELCTIPVPEEYEKVIIRIDGKEYELAGFEDNGSSGIECYEVDRNKFAFIGPIVTKPMIDLDYTQWANEKAKEAWSIEQKALSDIAVSPYLAEEDDDIDECDGGGAVGSDAGGSAASSDAGAAPAASADASGISTSDVLGDYEPGKGFMGGNFYLPCHVRCPLHRYGGEIAFSGSKRKKGKNGKPKKTPYEKGMKVIVKMFEQDADSNPSRISKSKLKRKLRSIASGIRSLDDVKAIEAKFNSSKDKFVKNLPSDRFKDMKQIAIDFGSFLKDICTGNYKASWFTVSMIAVGLIYLISPVDLIPDVLPVVGQIDDALVLWWIYKAIEDEFNAWKSGRKLVQLEEAYESLMTYDDLHGKEWSDIREKIESAKSWNKMTSSEQTKKLHDMYDRWSAAQLPAPEEDKHGELSYSMKEIEVGKRSYLDDIYIYGNYADGEILKIGPVKRSVATHYISLHHLSKNYKSYEKLKHDIEAAKPGFSPIRVINPDDKKVCIVVKDKDTKKWIVKDITNPKKPVTVAGPFDKKTVAQNYIAAKNLFNPIVIPAKYPDGFWLKDINSSFRVGPFDGKYEANHYAKDFGYPIPEPENSDKDNSDEGSKLIKYPAFMFTYTMRNVPCADIVIAETIEQAMKRFETQWLLFAGLRPSYSPVRDLASLQRTLTMVFIKNIEIEKLSDINYIDSVEQAEEIGNPFTNPSLRKYCYNRKCEYMLGPDEKKSSRLNISIFKENDEAEDELELIPEEDFFSI